jgi:hypothetical protein
MEKVLAQHTRVQALVLQYTLAAQPEALAEASYRSCPQWQQTDNSLQHKAAGKSCLEHKLPHTLP